MEEDGRVVMVTGSSFCPLVNPKGRGHRATSHLGFEEAAEDMLMTLPITSSPARTAASREPTRQRDDSVSHINLKGR